MNFLFIKLFQLKYFKRLIPSFRHKKDIHTKVNNTFFFKHILKKKYLNTKNLIKRKKKMFNTKHYPLFIGTLKYQNYIISDYVFLKKPYKKIFKITSLHNVNNYIPGIEHLNVGIILYKLSEMINFKRFYFKGFLIHIKLIPISILFSNVTDQKVLKVTFAKAGGTYCKQQKTQKEKNKLLTIILPSLKKLFLPKTAKAYVGKNENFNSHTLIEGS
jgi:ribosomal protein L2